jgi:fructose-1-phosphate kinase PfkB-like protein
MQIAVIGSLTRDRIKIIKSDEEFDQVGGGVYYSSMALASIGTDVLAVPLLAKKDQNLLCEISNRNIKISPQWTSKTTVYQNTYFGDDLEKCEKKFISGVSGFRIADDLIFELKSCDAIHLVPLSGQEFTQDLFSTLRKQFGGTISLDGQGLTRGEIVDSGSLLKGNIDIIKVDNAELLQITGCSNEKSAVSKILNWGIKEIAVTKGSRGSTIYLQKQVFEISSRKPRKIIDPTGCGDVYIAAYLFMRLQGKPVSESANFASELASINIGVKGALKENCKNLNKS